MLIYRGVPILLKHGRRKRGQGGPSPPWILKLLAKKIVFQFWGVKNKIHRFPPWKKSFQRPCTEVCHIALWFVATLSSIILYTFAAKFVVSATGKAKEKIFKLAVFCCCLVQKLAGFSCIIDLNQVFPSRGTCTPRGTEDLLQVSGNREVL